MCKIFDTALPAHSFIWRVLIFSGLSLLPFLALFVSLTPGFAAMLTGNADAFSRFARQVITNGLLVVFAVNYVGFFTAGLRLAEGKATGIPALLRDALLRACIFVALHVLVYIGSARLFGSFGGDSRTALEVVGPTLLRSAIFENISGSYLYALLPGAYCAYRALLVTPVKDDRPLSPLWSILVSLGLCASVPLFVTLAAMALEVLTKTS
jgi:hypothetical protein